MDDMKQCNANKCLYFMKVGSKTHNEIMKVHPNGDEIAAWSVEKARGQLSVTRESNILLTVSSLNQLHEYTLDGQLVQIIQLTWSSGISDISHAIKLISGHFLVCHGNNASALKRVCIIDVRSDVSFGDPKETTWLHHLAYMDIDTVGNVLVADPVGCKILQLDFKRQIITQTRSHRDFYYPRKLIIDESNRRVFVVQHTSIGQIDQQ